MNVIVFNLRGCPAHCLGAYGNEWIATPQLDRAAAEGIVFDRHISDCPEEQAARRAWRTGQDQAPFLPGLNPPTPLIPAPDLLNELRRAGVRTILVRANHPDTDVPDWGRGWDEVVEARPQAEDASPLDELLKSFPAWLESLAGHPRWFAWVEIDRLLPPWDVSQAVFDAYIAEEGTEEEKAEKADDPEEESDSEEEEDSSEEEESETKPEPVVREPVPPWADPSVGPFDRADLEAWEWLHCSRAAVVSALDDELGKLFDRLRERDTASWLITADFGWPLGEHGHLGPHRPYLHEEFVHVPLILRLSQAREAGRRVEALTQPADLMPTLRELFGLPTVENAATQGRSLLPLPEGKASAGRALAVSGLILGPVGEWAVRTPEWAYLVPALPHPDDPPRQPLLFVKPDDRWEVNDVHVLHEAAAEQLAAVLKSFTPTS